MSVVWKRGAIMPKVPYSKRKDERYYKQIIIGVDDKGKRKVKTLNSRKGENWKDFDKRVRAYMLNIDAGRVIDSNITFGECIELWLKTQVQLSPNTFNLYKSHLKKLSHLYHIKLQDLKPVHFRLFYNDLYEANANGLINRIPHLVNNVLDFAVDNDFLMVNIHRKVKIPRLKLGKRRALTENEKQAVIKAFTDFTPFQKAFIGLLYYTGMRRGEALALKVDDIDFEAKCINICRTLTKNQDHKMIVKDGTKTEAGMRKVPIISELESILMDYIDTIDRSKEYLFLNRNGGFFGNSSIKRAWDHILEKINLHILNGETTTISPHYFRHNFATELAYSNIPMKSAQYILGHEHITVTMDIYADVKFNIDDTVNMLEAHWIGKNN